MPAIKGILLDIDNTLYDYDSAHAASLKKTLRTFSRKLHKPYKTLEKAFYSARNDTQRSLKNTAASHNRMLYFQKMFEILNSDPLRNTLNAYDLYWDTFLARMKISRDALDFLAYARKRNIKICIVTDLTANIQHRKVVKFGLYKYSDKIVTSEEAGCEKPCPRIFKLALKKLGLKKDRVCIIGDDPLTDIAGARKMGIKAFWFTKERAKRTKGVVPFRSFHELIGEIK